MPLSKIVPCNQNADTNAPSTLEQDRFGLNDFASIET